MEIHELLGMVGEPIRIGTTALERFRLAREAMAARRFHEAAEGFREVRDMCGGNDEPSEFYLQLIERFEKEPPSEGWDGVVAFESK